MTDQFIRTPFNRDCAHHRLFFPTRTEACPYCGAESKYHRTTRRLAQARMLFWALAAIGLYLWLISR